MDFSKLITILKAALSFLLLFRQTKKEIEEFDETPKNDKPTLKKSL